MRHLSILPLLAVLLAVPVAAVGQSVPAASPQSVLSWVPPGFEALGQRAAFHTDFTFDRSMLQLAGYFVGDADPEARNAIAKLNGISVHSYHFAAPGLYDPRMLDLVRRQYEAAGWRHLVASHGKGDPFDTSQTDLWISFAHADVTGMMVLISSAKDVDLIAFSGDISPLDLLHLRGHFGIPRFSGDGFVPGPSAPARPEYEPAPPQASVQDAPPAPTSDPAPPPASDPAPGGLGVGIQPQAVEAAPPPPVPPGR